MSNGNKFNTYIEFTATLHLKEEEARALMVLFSYQGGVEGFIKTFKKEMGAYYLEPHEHGLHSLAKTLGDQLSPHLYTVDVARKLINEAVAKLCVKCGATDGRHYTDCESIKPKETAK